MEEPDQSSFDDPELKAALKRALGGEKAPASLRHRLEEVLVSGSSPLPQLKPAQTWNVWRRPLIGLAAAVLIMGGVGASVWLWQQDRNAPQISKSAAFPALPDQFAADLVTTHDHCCSQPDHHVLKGIPDNDFRLMTQKLREQLGFPALAAAAGDGWKFYGASGLCMVGRAHSAHLVFKKDDESLSLFSVAVSSEAWPDGKKPVDGDRFENMQAGHPITSWVHDDTVYSVVGASKDGSMGFGDINPIADEMRVALGGDESSGQNRTTVALR